MRAPLLFAGAVAGLLSVVTRASAEDKKPASPIELKVVSKKDKYVFDGGGMTPKEYKEKLEELAKKLEKGERATPPKAAQCRPRPTAREHLEGSGRRLRRRRLKRLQIRSHRRRRVP